MVGAFIFNVEMDKYYGKVTKRLTIVTVWVR